jgi:hypothetical protein
MRKLVLMSGGFHPFHAGHRSLYFAALDKFPDAQILVGATNDTQDRPFPFNIKQALAQLAGIPKQDFVQVNQQFRASDPAIMSRIKGQESDTALIFVRSEKDQGKPPLPPQRDQQGNLPLVTRGARKGQPVSDYLTYYQGNENNLEPMTKRAYIDYLPVAKFGQGMTSATEIRNTWPSLNHQQKIQLVKDMYPLTNNNEKLAQKAIQLIDIGLGVNSSLQENLISTVLPYLKSALSEFRSGDTDKLHRLIKEWKLLESKIFTIEKIFQNQPQHQPDYINEK